MPSYSEFKKQAWGVLGTDGDFSNTLPKLTPEQKAHNAMINDAFNEGFIEGGAGALAGDGYRGLVRGALQLGADSINEVADAPVRVAAIPTMLGGKAITYATGDDRVENGIRKTRNFLNNVFNLPTHIITGGIKDLANSKLLDPKHLSPEAYKGAVDAGKLGVTLADLAITHKMPVAAANATVYPVLADGVTRGAAAVEDVVKEGIKERKAQANHNAAIELFAKRHKAPNGPVVDWNPEIKSFAGKPTSLFDIVGLEELKKDPEGKELLRQQRIQNLKEQIDYDKQVADLVKKLKQTTGAGLGGVGGLVAAHQITKRIPALKKRKALRYLLNIAAAGGLGYAGWKLAGKR